MNQAVEFSDILRTKLYRPKILGAWVDRPRLLDRLDTGRQRPLTLVAAPAGYGKTTLISSWLEATDCPNAWISLDEGDNDLVQFLTYLLAAVETVFPGAVSETPALLKAAIMPPLPMLIRSLLNEIDRIDRAFVLVLDDYHHIHENAVHNLLDELLAHPPRPMHLLLISRTDPPLKLARYRARRLVTEVRTPDLRFTRDEVAVYIQREMGAPVDKSTVDTLHQEVEGWVTGLRLVVLSQRHRGAKELTPTHLQGSVSYISEYLTGEVLESLTPSIQEYLLCTAVLDRFCASLCQAVFSGFVERASAVHEGIEAQTIEKEIDGELFLEWLTTANLFVIPLDDEGRWFQYHHLFQEFLQRLLARRTTPEEIAVLHQVASTWYAAEGLIEAALQHALAAGDTSSAVNLVIRHRHETMNQEQGQRLERWLNLLPQEAVEQSPQLLLASAWVLYLQTLPSRLGEVAQFVERAAAMLEADDSTLTAKEREVLDGEIAAFRSIPTVWMGSGQLALELARHALSVTPIEHEWVRAISLTFYVAALHFAGHQERAYEEAHKILAGGRELAGALRNQVYVALFTIELLTGNLRGAEQAARQHLISVEQRQLYDSLGWALYTLGFVYYQRNQLAEARDNFARLVEWRYRTNGGAVTQGYVGLALTYQAMGDMDKAMEICQDARALASENGDAGMMRETNTLVSRLNLLRSQTPVANRWAESLGDAVPVMLWLSIPHLTLVNVLLAQGTPESLQEAGELLARLRRSAQDTHNTWRLMGITALQALHKAAEGEQQTALDLLEPVLAWAEPRGYIRLFADMGPRMAVLLNQLRSQGIASDYVGQILAAFPDQATDIASPLTPREVEVLALLAQGLSNKEIASELVLTTNSVKQYTHRIYQKLGVKNRHKAVKTAHSRGMLPALR